MDETQSGDRPGLLTLVATPIGNLDDLSSRAASALREADLVLAEDTRRTAKLLALVESSAEQWSLHDHNERDRIPSVLGRLARGDQVALVSDAGTPAVSDPGFRLVRAAIDAGIEVSAVPGPNAALMALSISGLPTDRFIFEGFLPRSGAARANRLSELAAEPRTIVLYLSPHRALGDVGDLAGALGGDRLAALCRELTKLHEEVIREALSDLATRLETKPKGELTLVVAGASAAPATEQDLRAGLVEVTRRVHDEAMSVRDAVAAVAADRGLKKRRLYQAVVEAGADAETPGSA